MNTHTATHQTDAELDSSLLPDPDAFRSIVARSREAAERSGEPGGARATVCVPLVLRLMGDQLTPVVAYRRLVAADDREAPSFLFESVEGGDRAGRYSILGSRPILELTAHANRCIWSTPNGADEPFEGDPLAALRTRTADFTLALPDEADGGALLPDAFFGGWVGFAGYDTVRYAEPHKLPFDAAPDDDRGLPDLHFAFYDGAVVFDAATKLVSVIRLAMVPPDTDPAAAYDAARADAEDVVRRLRARDEPMTTAVYTNERPSPDASATPLTHDTSDNDFRDTVERAREYIRAGDVFQVVLGRRTSRRSAADPFDVYRALRVVNPSPYMTYLQARGCILVGSSPEILCRVRHEHAGPVVTNRPLAGTRPRGRDSDEDAALERDLLGDEKERAEHVMLVDLARNDVGRIAKPGSIRLEALLEVERYSHVMHLSSTVTGVLRPDLDAWSALRSTLPVGTVSGAPKVRAVQVIDELESSKRGPYAGGFGYVTLNGEMDIALALRTLVIPTAQREPAKATAPATWLYDARAAAGIVWDSTPQSELDETVNKSRAMLRAIDVAERSFRPPVRSSG